MKAPGVILLVTLFGGAGFASGYLISRQKYYKLADKEVQSMKDKMPEHDRNLLIAAGVDPDNVDIDYRKVKKNNEKTSATITPEVIASEKKDRLEEEVKSKPLVNKTNYAGIAKTYKTSTVDEMEKSPMKKPTKATVTIIGEDTANLESEEYPTQLIYYKDGVVADIDDNAIANYESMIGELEFILEDLKKNGSVYVRNETTKEIYCIEISENNWKDVASDVQLSAFLRLHPDFNDN